MSKEWKEITEATFDQEFKTGLSRDMYSEIMGIGLKIEFLSGSGQMSKLKPIRTFEEYIANISPEEIERFRKGSKPEAIVAYDALVREFNSKIDSIKDNIEALREYEEKFKEMICGKNN